MAAWNMRESLRNNTGTKFHMYVAGLKVQQQTCKITKRRVSTSRNYTQIINDSRIDIFFHFQYIFPLNNLKLQQIVFERVRKNNKKNSNYNKLVVKNSKMDLFTFIWTIILYGSAAAVTLLVSISIIIYVITNPYPIVERFQEETTYNDPKTKSKAQFPNITDPQSVHLSVVVPAYNEEERLPPMLDEAIEFLEGRVKQQPSYKYEIIVVSDGSRDNTVQVTEGYSVKYGSEKVRCLELIKNRGKGGAVRLGIESCRGASILFADADGASKFEDLTKLEVALKSLTKCDPFSQQSDVSDCKAIVIGSRAHLEKESLATRSVFRNILMYGFHFLVWLFTVKGIKDTQCGFKLFTRKAADICFKSLHVNRWAFDVELLYIAQKLNIPIAEIPVRWTEIEGSKVTPVISWLQMGRDLGLIWLKYTIGAWKIKSPKTD